MKKILFAICATTLLFGSCKQDEPATPTTPTSDVIELTGDISADKTLDATKKYLLKGFVYVTKGAKLTIPAGTVVMGDKASKGTLVITRGSKIDAQGTATKPVVFTSSFAAGTRQAGDWGGIVLLGKATINASAKEAKLEGGLVPTNGGNEKDYIWYGGSDDNDNSGIIKYARIEFAGIALSPDNELNSLTMGGVGAGTTLSYIQVYRAGDDAFEWFGGTVNADHLVASYTWDDDFDTDFGYSGNVQFGVAQRHKNLADISGSNGFESDNNADGTTASPQTRAVFSNMTIVGPIIAGSSTSGINSQFQHGAQIRRNSAISIRNSIIVGFPLAGLYIDGTKGTPTHNNLGATGVEGPLVFKNNILAGNTVTWKVGGLKTAGDTTIWNNFKGQASNTIVSKAEDVLMVAPNKYGSSLAATAGVPSFVLQASSPAVSGADFTGMPTFQSVSYRGAFDASNDWTAGWTNWDAEQTKY